MNMAKQNFLFQHVFLFYVCCLYSAPAPKGGADGVLHIVNSTLDLDWVLKDGPHHPYIPIVAQTFFNR